MKREGLRFSTPEQRAWDVHQLGGPSCMPVGEKVWRFRQSLSKEDSRAGKKGVWDSSYNRQGVLGRKEKKL